MRRMLAPIGIRQASSFPEAQAVFARVNLAIARAFAFLVAD
jgi:hypothetical protein